MPFRKCVETFTFGICPLWRHTNSSLPWFSINSTPSPGVGSSQWDRLVVSFQMFEVQQKQARTEDANSVLNVPFSLQDCWGYTFLFLRSAGDPKVQTVVARSQPARQWRQRSTESPGDSEEQRTRGRFAGMFFDTAALPAGAPRPFNLSALLHSQPAAESDRLRLWTWPPRRRRSKPGWSTKASPECETQSDKCCRPRVCLKQRHLFIRFLFVFFFLHVALWTRLGCWLVNCFWEWPRMKYGQCVRRKEAKSSSSCRPSSHPSR